MAFPVFLVNEVKHGPDATVHLKWNPSWARYATYVKHLP